jgi:hypothetical protein
MRKNGIPEKAVKNGKVLVTKLYKTIPFLSGRPKRDTAINADDIVNLQIALYTARTFKDFLKQI